MTKIKSKTNKTSRKATEPKPQSKKKGKTPTKRPSAKEKEQPTEAPPTTIETETTTSDSLATATAEPGTTAEKPVAVAASAGETASVSPPAEEPSTAPAGATTSESRMPAIGTVLQKRDRNGNLRCECEVVDGGVRYGGTVYRSLSSAAVAAAKDLGLAAKAMNGFTFWGVRKPTRAAADPLDGVERAWSKYQDRLEAALDRARGGENREAALTTLERHSRILQNLREEAPNN